MRIPSEVVVAPYTITLRADSDACAAAQATGTYLEDDGVIIFDDRRPDHIVLDSVVHELLHAIWAQAGMNEIVDSTDAKSDGERIIRAITPRLIALLRDNPQISRLIISKQRA
jgi:hypothetical protein